MNGTSQLGGWIVALCAGRSFVGQRKEVPGIVRLSPVCEMARQLVQGPQGQTAIACGGMPPLLFGLDSLDLPEAGTVVIPFTQLSEEERSACMKAAASAEEMRKAMRAASAGIVLAGPGVKLPPLAGKP